MLDMEQLRAYFPHTRHTIYFNHAAMAPLSTPVVEAIGRFLDLRHGHDISNFGYALERGNETRHMVAQVLGTEPEHIAFVQNTSLGLNMLTLGIDWQPGDRIAVPDCEFPANVYPFLNLERRGVKVDFIPSEEGVVTLEAIERTLRPETRLLAISWVQFLSGYRVDLKEVGALCQANDTIFSVDAIQAFGALQPPDTMEACGIDFLVTGGQKWLMSIQGQGFFYISPRLMERLVPPMAGWLHGPVDWEHLWDYKLAFHPDARRFELGTPNAVGTVALHAAMKLYLEVGPSWVEEQVLARSRQLAQGLDALGYRRYGSVDPEHASGIVAVYHPEPEALQKFLSKRNIKTAMRNCKVRFSPTYYNTEEEVQHVLDVLEEFEQSRIATG